MIAFMEAHYSAVLAVGLVVAVILFTICIIGKFIRLAIGIAILSVIIPILFTIFWGDGSAYITELASYLTPKYQQQLEDAYAYYKEKDAEDPVVDYDAVSNKVTDVFSAVKEKEWEMAGTAKEYAQDYAEELLKKASQTTTNTAGPGS